MARVRIHAGAMRPPPLSPLAWWYGRGEPRSGHGLGGGDVGELQWCSSPTLPCSQIRCSDARFGGGRLDPSSSASGWACQWVLVFVFLFD